MARWVGKFHKRVGEIRSRAVTELWYKSMFYGMGPRCSITPPFFPYQAEYVQLGAGVSIGPFCRIEAHPAPVRSTVPQPLLRIGDRVRIGHGVNLSCRQSLIIGDNVLIGGGSYISDNNHSIDPEGARYLDQPLSSKITLIGKGAWLGQHVCVLAGSSIGERAVIGAGSVVSGAIPAYSIAVGNPARVIKQYCFETKQWKRSAPVEDNNRILERRGS